MNKIELTLLERIYWNAVLDVIQYRIRILNNEKITKRQMLFIISQIFDPLGLVGPILIVAKMMLKSLWK